jgi:hypothetical protein
MMHAIDSGERNEKMKIQEHSNKLETNVEAESQNFGIGDASVVIEILRNRLYQNKVQTLVQEYICNARDAMREVSKGNEFEVTVPTRLNPVFKVRDFGPGISPSRMQGVFVMYGSSTKRGTNGQTGGFGLGAKSGWAYTDSFTIVSIVDGVRRTYIAHTGVNNNGRLDLVATDQTNEANGTEIQVAVKPNDVDEFRKAIFRATYFWKDKPVLKGELDPPTLVEGKRLSDLVEVIDLDMLPEYIRPDGYHSNPSVAVIDGIPYPINPKVIEKVESFGKLTKLLKESVIFHFGNGVVEVAASRESIADSEHTIKAIKKMADRALLEVQTHISDAFGKVKSTNEYLTTYASMSESFNVDKFAKFGGYEIVNHWITGPLLKKVRVTVVSTLNSRGRKIQKVSRTDLREAQREIKIKDFNKIFFVSKDENRIITSKRMREYLKNDTTMILVWPLTIDAGAQDSSVTYTAEYDQVIKDLNAKDFCAIQYTEEPKAPKGTNPKIIRDNTEFCIHTLGWDRHVYTTVANNTQKYFFVPMQDGSWEKYNKEELKELSKFLEENKSAKICGLAERAVKMVKGNANFLPLADYLSSYKASKDEIKFAKYKALTNDHIVHVLDGVKGINDKFLNEMVEEYKEINRTKLRVLPKILLNKVNEEKEVKEFKERDKELTTLVNESYPLLTEVQHYSRYKNELVFYINAKCKKGK